MAVSEALEGDCEEALGGIGIGNVGDEEGRRTGGGKGRLSGGEESDQAEQRRETGGHRHTLAARRLNRAGWGP
jgi:hypothetical protein